MTVTETTIEQWIRESLALPSADECIEWPFNRQDGRYGTLMWRGKMRKATHVVLELSGRPRPEPPSNWALHSCDNPGCVNPGHLRWGSRKDNTADMVTRGRHRGGGASGPARTVKRKQMNVRLWPETIERADVRRADLGLSRDRYIEQLIEADTAPPEPEPSMQELAEAAELAARIQGVDTPAT